MKTALKQAQKDSQIHFMALMKWRKRSDFASYSYFKTRQLQQLKGMQSFKLGMWKRSHFSIEGIRKGYLSVKNGIKGQGVGPRGGASPYKTFLSTPSLRKLRKVFKQRSRFFINSVIFKRILIYRLLMYSSKIDCIKFLIKVFVSLFNQMSKARRGGII